MTMAPHSCVTCGCQCSTAQRTTIALRKYYLVVLDIKKIMDEHSEMPLNPSRINEIFTRRGLIE